MNEKLSMLVVDDVEVNRASFREMFRSEYNVMEASDGLEAMKKLYESHVDIVILDLFMPNLDGEGVLKRMKSDPQLDHIPVVVKTAIDENTGADLLDMGADDFIFSPCDPALVKNRVKNIVEKYVFERTMMQKQIEAEKQMRRARAELADGFFAEIRRMANEIIKYSEQGYSGEAPAAKDAFVKIRHQGEELLALVERASGFKETDTGKLYGGKRPFQLNAVIGAISAEAYARCRKKEIDLQFEISDVFYENLIGDPEQLKQIWVNLLENAYRGTAGGMTIWTSFHERKISKNRVELEICVRDNGRTGGLAVTKSIAELMGGSVTVELTADRIPAVSVKLPFELGKEPAIHPKKFNSMKAMVLDDNEVTCNYLAAILGRLGIECKIAANRSRALMMLREAYINGNGYDICFVNWYMDNGEAMIEEIRQLFDRDTLMLVSATGDVRTMEPVMKRAGVDHVLPKPLFQSTLYNLLTEMCRDEPENTADAGGYDFEGKKVLVVEDNAINAKVLIGYLKEVNMESDWVNNGKAAVEKYREMKTGYYSGILMDICMPVMDGYQAAKQIRSLEKQEKRKTPVIAVTANAFSRDIVKVYEAGMSAHISKPVDTTVLYRTLKEQILQKNV